MGAESKDSQREQPLSREDAVALFKIVEQEMNEMIFGQEGAVHRLLAGILVRQHILLEGAQGLGKTTLPKAMAKVLGVTMGRVQCTTDSTTEEILGRSVGGHFVPGPVFDGDIILFDELNHLPPKMQAALNQVMEEGEVTCGSLNIPLPQPFSVVATQNPKDAGSDQITAAVMDRFGQVIEVTMPNYQALMQIVCAALTGNRPAKIVLENDQLLKIKEIVQQGGLNENTRKRLVKMIAEATALSNNQESNPTNGKALTGKGSAKNVLKDGQLSEIQEIVQLIPLNRNLRELLAKLIDNTNPKTTSVEIVKENIQNPPSLRTIDVCIELAKALAFLNSRNTVSQPDLDMAFRYAVAHRLTLNDRGLTASINNPEIIQKIIDEIIRNTL